MNSEDRRKLQTIEDLQVKVARCNRQIEEIKATFAPIEPEKVVEPPKPAPKLRRSTSKKAVKK